MNRKLLQRKPTSKPAFEPAEHASLAARPFPSTDAQAAPAGHSFAQTAVHGEHADTLHRALNARAFTTSQDVSSRQNESQPDSRTGEQAPERAAAQPDAQTNQLNKTMQAKAFTTGQPMQQHSAVIQRVEEPEAQRSNNTGLPDALKSGIENLSGMSLDDVKVHYNSAQPAQLNALAFAQGTDIHVAPGQEQHLPHEAWHVVQQAQGRVQPTMQMKQGVQANDDQGLEHEADVMGAKALTAQAEPVQLKGKRSQGRRSTTIQMAGHPEDLCVLKNWLAKRADKIEIEQYTKGEVPPTAPKFKGPYYTAEDALEFLSAHGEVLSPSQKDKIATMAETMAKGGKGFMMLENATAGMASAKMRDMKMGKESADEDDQARHGITGIANSLKMGRHFAMDKKSGSDERGYRDEDQWKVTWTGDNLEELKKMLVKTSKAALQGISDALQSLDGWLKSSQVVYVGMSVLVVVGGDTGKAVAIDFEHPIKSSEMSFKRHQAGLIFGVESLRGLVMEYYNSYDSRAQVRRQRRRAAIVQGGGSINKYGEGNASIGNDDL